MSPLKRPPDSQIYIKLFDFYRRNGECEFGDIFIFDIFVRKYSPFVVDMVDIELVLVGYTKQLIFLLTTNTSWPRRTEMCLHYDALLSSPRARHSSRPVLAEDSLFFTVYPPPAAWIRLLRWADMKAAGSDVYIWSRGSPLRGDWDKTTLPSSLLFFLWTSFHSFFFFSFHQIHLSCLHLSQG